MIIPSIIAKNQKDLNTKLKKLKGVSKKLHLDVVDGRFANNKSLNFPFRLSKDFSYIAHLMIKKPRDFIEKNYRRIELFLPQIETINLKDYIYWIKQYHKKVGVALKPETSLKEILPFIDKLDYVLILTVKPGYYGSKFMRSPLKKIIKLKKRNLKLKIIVDGGMNPNTIVYAVKAGADHFISGSFVTQANNPSKAINKLRSIVKNQGNL